MEKKIVPSKNYFAVVTTTTLNKIQEVAARETDKLIAGLSELQLEPVGPMEFIYFDCTEDREKEFTLEIALPVKETNAQLPKEFSFKKHPAFQCVSYVHKGGLTNLHEVYEKLFTDMWDNSQTPTNQIREVYVNYTDAFSVDNITEIQIGLQ